MFLSCAAFLLTSIQATLAFTPELAGNSPQPAIGNPLYYAISMCYQPNQGVYASVNPTTVRVDSVPGQNYEEYWAGISAVGDTDKCYTEVAVDIIFDKSVNQWHTVAYAAYADSNTWPNGNTFANVDLGWSSSAPATATVSVYVSSGSTWTYVVNGNAFTTITYSSSWTASRVQTSMESYANPHGWTSGQTILTNSNINYKSTNGVWTSATNLQGQISSGFQVTQTLSSGTQRITSTRYFGPVQP